MNNYIQTTYETCLAISLLNILKIHIDKTKEKEVIIFSLDFSKDSFTLGHLEYFCKYYDSKFNLYIDNDIYKNFLWNIKFSQNINLVNKKINLTFIDKFIQENKSIVIYFDSYYLYKIVHYPHFITILGKEWEKYKIYDSWDWKVKFLDSSILWKWINSLRKILKFCPQLIELI